MKFKLLTLIMICFFLATIKYSFGGEADFVKFKSKKKFLFFLDISQHFYESIGSYYYIVKYKCIEDESIQERISFGTNVEYLIKVNYFDSVGVKYDSVKYKNILFSILKGKAKLKIHNYQISDLGGAFHRTLDTASVNNGVISDSFFHILTKLNQDYIEAKYFDKEFVFIGDLHNNEFNALVKYFFLKKIGILYFDENGTEWLKKFTRFESGGIKYW